MSPESSEQMVRELDGQVNHSIDEYESTLNTVLLSGIQTLRDQYRSAVDLTYGRGEWPDFVHTTIDRLTRLFTKSGELRPFRKYKGNRTKAVEDNTTILAAQRSRPY